jgi:hypothetical protein
MNIGLDISRNVVVYHNTNIFYIQASRHDIGTNDHLFVRNLVQVSFTLILPFLKDLMILFLSSWDMAPVNSHTAVVNDVNSGVDEDIICIKK